MASLEDKRVQNISEYIIQVYQAEDLIRQHKFNLDALFAEHIDALGGSEEEKSQNRAWYTKVAHALEEEGSQEKGHLGRLDEYIKELNEIHFHLLRSDRVYRGHFDQAKLHINRHMQAHGGELSNPIQICLNGIFLFKSKRAKQEALTESDREGMHAFVELCSYLSYRYRSRHESNGSD
ncbi:MAG TPA: hypothetical protein DCE41_14335 [Cytophagales bacterium]|nr:hypothetical protein [Cytophagales bacterium]HAP64686.1 hypothetical protein [Cytophagales bacterium]